MVLYHGTDDPNVVGIGGGYLGAGVYFTPDKDAAELIAAHQGMGFVMTCSVDVGAVYDFDAGSPGLARGSHHWSSNDFDSATRVHTPWAGVQVPFREYCVRTAWTILRAVL